MRIPLARTSLSCCAVLATAVGTLGLAQAASPSSTSSTTVTERQLTITRGGADQTVAYCGNGSVEQTNQAVRRVVVVVHGSSRNSCDYAKYVRTSAVGAGTNASTLVVAPRFITSSDPESKAKKALYWSDGGWKDGSNSLTSPRSRPWTMSSYEVVDQIMSRLAVQGRFPNLMSVVVAGHSAGGQFVNRYAATSRSVDAAGVTRGYVVANPSSYLYFSSQRPDPAGVLRSLTASQVSSCPGYDRYKYGLQRLNPYAALSGADLMRTRYAAARVTYLNGGADTATGSSLDTSCAGRLEGANRLDRGLRYFAALGTMLPRTVYANQVQLIVPGVGHSGKSMFTSQQGKQALFPEHA